MHAPARQHAAGTLPQLDTTAWNVTALENDPQLASLTAQDETVAAVSEEHKCLINVDGERPLICVRASGAHSEISLAQERLSIGVAVGTFEIEDLLVGPRCKRHSHLARSYEAADVTEILVSLDADIRSIRSDTSSAALGNPSPLPSCRFN